MCDGDGHDNVQFGELVGRSKNTCHSPYEWRSIAKRKKNIGTDNQYVYYTAESLLKLYFQSITPRSYRDRIVTKQTMSQVSSHSQAGNSMGAGCCKFHNYLTNGSLPWRKPHPTHGATRARTLAKCKFVVRFADECIKLR